MDEPRNFSSDGDAVSNVDPREVIDRVPTELLVQVFLLATGELREIGLVVPAKWYSHTKMETRSLISLTHVCRKWRQVVLQAPLLWTRMNCYTPSQLRAFWERSRGLPISLAIHHNDIEHYVGTSSTPEATRDKIEEILAVTHQLVRSLDLRLEGEDGMDHSPPSWLSSCDMPNLEVLVLSIRRDRKTRVSRKNALIGNNVRSLKALAITELGGWFPVDMFPSLTHLLLDCTNASIKELLRLLRDCPKIEVLHLPGSYFEFDGVVADPVSLPTLKLLAFTGADSKTLDLLRFVHIHHTVPIRMMSTFISVDDSEETFSPEDIFPIPFDIIPSIRGATHLDIRMNEGLFEVHFALHGAASGLWMFGSPYPTYGYQWLVDQIRRLSTDAPLSDVTSVVLDIPGSSPAVLVDLLRHLPSLETLTLRLYCPGKGGWQIGSGGRIPFEGSPADVLGALCDALAGQAGAHASEPPTCPALRALAVCANIGTDVCEDVQAELDRWRARLEEMLDARAATAAPIRSLRVQPTNRAYCGYGRDQGFDLEATRAAFEEGLSARVEKYSWVPPGETFFEEFKLWPLWRVGGEEEYWRLDSKYQPTYRAPERS
ncbi:uncharacterized protein BXZ73DRAFT_105239 [Epithele typhae]|uniref:uncharacterized protein n=1 Tax=Epithele typhae TaxID=378194 RepID=UPI00200875FE|nr:uncharacterized protein BXZ73DRAFT_105239 [Epithele typhae]KAH9918356.1 hypothetical protein BXZ73DRAFT_105239 [Epithele typhae]